MDSKFSGLETFDYILISVALISFVYLVFREYFVAFKLPFHPLSNIRLVISGRPIAEQLSGVVDDKFLRHVLLTSSQSLGDLIVTYALFVQATNLLILSNSIEYVGQFFLVTILPSIYYAGRFTQRTVDHYFKPHFDRELALELKHTGKVSKPRVNANLDFPEYPQFQLAAITITLLFSGVVYFMETASIMLCSIFILVGVMALWLVRKIAQTSCLYHYSTNDNVWSQGYLRFKRVGSFFTVSILFLSHLTLIICWHLQ